MRVKEQLKFEIDKLDERYLELLLKIIYQFPHVHEQQMETQQSKKIASILQDIADAGGLGINDPVSWQRDIRKERALPFRN